MAGIAGPMLPEIASKIPFPIDFSVIFLLRQKQVLCPCYQNHPAHTVRYIHPLPLDLLRFVPVHRLLQHLKHLVPLLFFHDLQCFHPLD